MPIPYAFIRRHASLSWHDALWGYEHQMIGWSGIVELAKDRLCCKVDQLIIELSQLKKSEAWKVGELLHGLVFVEYEQSELALIKKWLFLNLYWLFENKEKIEDPLGEVEKIYADFNYPHEIESFIRYMPASGNYDPAQYTIKENINRLFYNWRVYLDLMQCENHKYAPMI